MLDEQQQLCPWATSTLKLFLHDLETTFRKRGNAIAGGAGERGLTTSAS